MSKSKHIDDQRKLACHALIALFRELLWAASCFGAADNLTAIYRGQVNGAAMALWATGIITDDEKERLYAMSRACLEYKGPAPE